MDGSRIHGMQERWVGEKRRVETDEGMKKGRCWMLFEAVAMRWRFSKGTFFRERDHVFEYMYGAADGVTGTYVYDRLLWKKK